MCKKNTRTLYHRVLLIWIHNEIVMYFMFLWISPFVQPLRSWDWTILHMHNCRQVQTLATSYLLPLHWVFLICNATPVELLRSCEDLFHVCSLCRFAWQMPQVLLIAHYFYATHNNRSIAITSSIGMCALKCRAVYNPKWMSLGDQKQITPTVSKSIP